VRKRNFGPVWKNRRENKLNQLSSINIGVYLPGLDWAAIDLIRHADHLSTLYDAGLEAEPWCKEAASVVAALTLVFWGFRLVRQSPTSPYLRAFLNESMTLFPPTTHGLPRVTPEEGWLINRYFIPRGTTVAISAYEYTAHRDEKIFPEPEKFKPERWLGNERKPLQPYFVAFSAKARGCIRRNISILEQTVLLASALRRYEFGLPHPRWETERRETMNLHLGPLPLKV
jgi:cytochrome P450